MSFIIGISKPTYFYHFTKPTTLLSKSQASRPTDMSFKSNSLALTIQEALKLQQIQFCSRTLPSGHSFITTEQFELGKSMGGVVNFKVSAVEGHINVKVDILTNRQQFFRIQSLDRRIFINRALSSAKNAPNRPFFKVVICMVKGTITLTLPLHYILQVVSMQNSSALRKTAILRKLIDLILLEAKSLIGFVLKKDDCLNSGVNKGNLQLLRLRQMMILFKGGWQGNEVMSEKSIRQYKTKQIKSIKDLIRNKIPNQHIPASLKSYLLLHEDDAQFKNQDHCVFNPYQAELVKKIYVPSRKVNKYDSNFSYTTANILIHRPEQIKVNPLNSGGFSAIYLAEVEYSFVDISQPKEQPKDKKIQKSLMVIKKQIGNCKKGSRNQREKNIIQKLKNSTSYMLNRYYFPINLPPASKTDIFMDHIPYPTLKDFLQMARQYFSLQSKLVILLSVVQGLRSLSQFDVVHLDLKPNNIMMNSQLGIKLLDFGQSYHPQVQKCKPGFTIPYACPQIYSGCTQFNVKSDVYSLGIIMFQILYKQYPFYFSNDANLDHYKTDSYLQHWFWYPQDANKLGQASIYQTISLMISRCLSKDENKRPQLLSIGLVLQQCINMLQ